jgi:hypothetical protein
LSHIVQIQTQIRDPMAIQAACTRLRLPAATSRTVRLFSGEVSGIAVALPEWRYPIVCDVHSGQVHFDNFQGAWGERAALDRFLQVYAAEKVKLEARKQGHSVTEQPLDDGSLKLAIQWGGAA